MAKVEEELQVCELCGATIYPEHLKAGAADRWMGKLLCKHCLDEKRQIAAVNPAAALGDGHRSADTSPLALLVDDEPEGDGTATAAAAEARPAAPPGGGSALALHRPLDPQSPLATRCKTFHCKLTDTAMRHLNDMINEWADADENIRIKFATNCIGEIEGKSSSDANLFITVFY